jgi:type I restriction enzyme, S subunit
MVSMKNNNFEIKKLGNIAKITMGQSPKSKYYNKKNIGLPLIQGNADIKNRKTIVRNFTSDYPKRANIGDTIMSVRAPVGEIAKATFDCCLGRGVCAISYVNDYIYYYLIFIEKKWISQSTGSTFNSINSKEVHNVKILLPKSKEEQNTIVKILSDTNELIKQLDYLIKKKKNIKQGTIQTLLTGKKRLDGFTDDWKIKKLGDCLTKKPEYGINASAVEYSYNLPTYIRITDISKDGEFMYKNKVSVNHDNTDQFFLEKGDIVFARTGASTGKTYLYDTKDGKLVFAGFLIKIKTDPTILLPEYLKKFTETATYWNWVKKTSVRSGQPGINADEYSKLTIPIPHPKEQYLISKILVDMDQEIKKLNTQKEKYIMNLQGMMQTLLTGEIILA